MIRIRTMLRVCVFGALMAAWPQSASAQWYVNPFIGQVLKIKNPFVQDAQVTKPDKATVIGIGGGTSPFGRVGFEVEFQRVKNMFRSSEGRLDPEELEVLAGDNYLQSITAAVHVGHAFAGGKVRPYGVFGGGLNYVNLGTEYEFDFDAFFNLPLPQQETIENCFNALGIPNPTLTQVQGCGLPLLTEPLTGYRGVIQFGGGVAIKLSKNLAAKGDIRFFKEVPKDEDAGEFSYWRIAVGVVLHR